MFVLNKKSFTHKLIIVCLLALTVSACSSTDDEIDDLRVAELTDINEKFTAKVIWEESVGDGVSDYFSRLKPVVAYDKVFSANRDGDVIAFDRDSGKKLWQVDLSNIDGERGFFDSRTSALLSGGIIAGINKVFIGSESGDIFALNADTGALEWQEKVRGEVLASPAIDAGTLVVNTASGVMKALNASNGEELWQVEQEVPALTLRGISPPAMAAGGVIVGSADGTVNVYLLDKGRLGWSADVGEATGSTELERVIDVDAASLVFGDKVYSISARGNLTAIELRSGRVLWQRKYSSYRQMSISGNSLFLTNIKGHVYAVDRINGLELWSQLSLSNRGVTGPAVVDNYIVVGDFEGYLHWLDQETGEFVARHHVDGSGIYATPVVSKDILYTQSRDGDLQAIKTP